MTVGCNIWDLGGSPSITCCYLRRRRAYTLSDRSCLHSNVLEQSISLPLGPPGNDCKPMLHQRGQKSRNSNTIEDQKIVTASKSAGQWSGDGSCRRKVRDGGSNFDFHFLSFLPNGFPIQILTRALKFLPQTPLGFHFSVLSGTLHTLKN